MYGSSKHATVKHSTTRIIEVFMAGDVQHAKQVIRTFCQSNHCCVTVTPTTYIYNGGEEAGFVVGVRSYPRFEAGVVELQSLAAAIGVTLRDALAQDSYMIVDHDGETFWGSTRQA